jgi:transposase InsO family protein
MKYTVISRAINSQKKLSLTALCSIACVSRAGYYSWVKRPQAVLSEIDTLIETIFLKHNRKSGYRTIKMELARKHNLIVNHKKILRSMRLQGLKTQIRKKRYPSISGLEEKSYAERAFPNLLDRGFSPDKPDTVYSADVTEFRTWTGSKVYLYAAKDLCTKEIVAYNVSSSPDASLVTETLKDRLELLTEDQRRKLIYHTDQGTVFMSLIHTTLTQRMAVRQSMSRRGNCLDNAPIESFWGHLKDEVDLSSCKNHLEALPVIAKYIYTYNNERPQWALNRKTPAECRGLYS